MFGGIGTRGCCVVGAHVLVKPVRGGEKFHTGEDSHLPLGRQTSHKCFNVFNIDSTGFLLQQVVAVVLEAVLF